MITQEVVGSHDLQVVAFDGHDLVVQMTCQRGKDRLGRPHIEVASSVAPLEAMAATRTALAEKFVRRGWRRIQGKTHCPSCAQLALHGTTPSDQPLSVTDSNGVIGGMTK